MLIVFSTVVFPFHTHPNFGRACSEIPFLEKPRSLFPFTCRNYSLRAGSSLKPNDICYIILAIYWYLYVFVEHNDVSFSSTSERNDHYVTIQQNFNCALYSKRRKWRNCVCWGAISCKSVTMKFVRGVGLCLQWKNLMCSGKLLFARRS